MSCPQAFSARTPAQDNVRIGRPISVVIVEFECATGLLDDIVGIHFNDSVIPESSIRKGVYDVLVYHRSSEQRNLPNEGCFHYGGALAGRVFWIPIVLQHPPYFFAGQKYSATRTGSPRPSLR